MGSPTRPHAPTRSRPIIARAARSYTRFRGGRPLRAGRPGTSDEPVAGDPADFLERADAGEAEAHTVRAQGGHSLADRCGEDLVGRALDEPTHLAVHGHDL